MTTTDQLVTIAPPATAETQPLIPPAEPPAPPAPPAVVAVRVPLLTWLPGTLAGALALVLALVALGRVEPARPASSTLLPAGRAELVATPTPPLMVPTVPPAPTPLPVIEPAPVEPQIIYVEQPAVAAPPPQIIYIQQPAPTVEPIRIEPAGDGGQWVVVEESAGRYEAVYTPPPGQAPAPTPHFGAMNGGGGSWDD